MRRNVFLVGLVLGSLLGGLASSASAQITPIGGGCPGKPLTEAPFGPPRVGMRFKAQCPKDWPHRCERPLIVVGFRAVPPIPFAGPILCRPPGTTCTLECRPLAVHSPCWLTMVPSDPGLVGVCVCLQCVCVNTNADGSLCLDFGGAIEACILP